MQYYILRVKDFLLKKTFDFDRPDITLFNFHPQLRFFLSVKGIFFANRNSKLRFLWPVICILISLVAFGMEQVFIWHALTEKDYSFATECFCYSVILGCIPMVYICIAINVQKIYGIVDAMNDDFVYVCSLGPLHRKPFLEGQLLIWQCCFAWFGFDGFVGGMYVLMPVGQLLYQSLFATQDEHMVRPLAFPVWLPYDDPYRTPNYEIFLLLESSIIFCFVLTFCVYIYTFLHILLHYNTLMSMMMIDFEHIFEGLDPSVAFQPRYDERRMRTQLILNARVARIVNWHRSVFRYIRAVNTVSSIYGPSLVYQVLFSSLAICLIAYQIADKLDHGAFDIMFFLLGIAACLQLWIPCYLGTMIRNQAFAVGDSCWSCGWHETPLGLLIRQDIIIIILRAQQPVTIKFTGLPHVQLETFSSLMSTSYSYFNMLRQYSK